LYGSLLTKPLLYLSLFVKRHREDYDRRLNAVRIEGVLAHEGMSVVALRLFELLPRHPVVTVASVMKLVETTKPTAGRAIELLVAAGVLVETTGKKRDRSFVYRATSIDSASAPSSTAPATRSSSGTRITACRRSATVADDPTGRRIACRHPSRPRSSG
jgi:Fic family protein